MPLRDLPCCLLVSCAVLASRSAAQVAPPDAAAPARHEHHHGAEPNPAQVTRLLGDALFNQDALASERAIIALRRLREPSLRPFFSQMAGLVSGESADGVNRASPLRRHGILGLAELSDPARIDLLLVKTISDRDERAALLREGIDLGLMTIDDVREVSRWPGLRPLVRVRMLGQLVRSGESVEASRLRDLLDEDGIASVYASLLLVETGGGREGVAGVQIGDRAPLQRLLARSVHAEPGIEALVEDIRRFHLTSGRPIVELVATEEGTPPVLRFEAVRTLLSIAGDDPEVCAAWRAAFAHSPDSAARARLALAALEVARERRRPFGGDIFTAMGGAAGGEESGGDELLSAMAEAGRAVTRPGRGTGGSAEGSAGAGAGGSTHESVDLEPLLNLVRQGHEPAAAWALQVAEDLPPQQASRVLTEALRAGRQSMREGYFVSVVVEASALLAGAEPAQLRELIGQAAAAGDGLFVRAALSGALRSDVAAAAEVAGGGPRQEHPVTWPDETSAAMARLLQAHHATERGPEQYAALAEIAMGRGELGEGLRVQAAWLALLCRDEGRSALARIMAQAPE